MHGLQGYRALYIYCMVSENLRKSEIHADGNNKLWIQFTLSKLVLKSRCYNYINKTEKSMGCKTRDSDSNQNRGETKYVKHSYRRPIKKRTRLYGVNTRPTKIITRNKRTTHSREVTALHKNVRITHQNLTYLWKTHPCVEQQRKDTIERHEG